MTQALTILVIGAVVGVIPGLFGVGGGFVTVPALHGLAGVDMTLAVGIAMAQALGPVTTGVLHRWRAGTLHVRLPVLMLGGTQVGLHFGFLLIDWMRQPRAPWIINGRTVSSMEVIVLALYVVILLLLAGLTAYEHRVSRLRGSQPRRGFLERWPIPPLVDLPEVDGRRMSLPWLSVLAVAIGFLNGGLGVGGALLMVPALVFLFGVSTHRAMTATLALGLLNGSIACFMHAWRGNMDLPVACWLLLGGTAGAHFGSVVNEQLSGRSLRGYFSLLILAAAVVLAIQLVVMLYG